MRKQILFVTLDFWPQHIGGVSTYYYHVCNVLQNVHDIDVLTTPLHDKKEIQTSFKIKRHKLFFDSVIIYPKWLKSLFVLNSLMKKKSYDHVFIGEILPLGSVYVLLSHIKKMPPFRVFLHGMDIAHLKGRKAYLAKKILNKACKIYCNSKYTASIAKTFIQDEKKIEIVYPCPNTRLLGLVDEEIGIVQKKKEQKHFLILTVSRFVKRKAIDDVIKSMPHVKKSLPNASYIIVGNGEEKENLLSLVKKYNLEDCVSILSDITDAQIAYLYKNCNVFILTPIDEKRGDIEGFGIVYLEANLFSLPVIAHNTGGVGDAVIEGETGIYVKDTSPHEIADKIVYLARHREYAAMLGENGKKRVLKEFTWENQVKKILTSL